MRQHVSVMYVAYGSIWVLFCLQYCKRKEKKISANFILNKKSVYLFNQFVSMTEREIDII